MGTITRKNQKGQRILQLGLQEVSYYTSRKNIWNYQLVHGKYYLKLFIENSTTKKKQRKANKLARKQRKRNHK